MSDPVVEPPGDGDCGGCLGWSDGCSCLDQKFTFGWRWIILFSGWISFALFSATLYTSGLFFVIYLDEFGETRSLTAWVGSLCSSVYLMYGPIVAAALSKFGCRVVLMSAGILACLAHMLSGAAPSLTSLYFSYGLLLPVPLAGIHTGWIVAVQKQFPESRGAATGVLMTGGGAGLFLLPPLLQWLIDTYGWRAAYCLLGAISLNWTPAAATIFNTSTTVAGKKSGRFSELDANEERAEELSNQLSFWRVVTDTRVIFFNLTSFFWMFSGGTMFIIFKDLLAVQGLSGHYQLCLQMVGAGDLAGRLLAGLASTHPPPHLPLMAQYLAVHILSCLVFAIFALLPSTNAPPLPALLLLFLVFGLSWGSQNLYLAVAPAAVLGVANITTVLGSLLFAAGAGQLIGPPLFGWLVDITSSYSLPLAIAASSQVCATGCSAIASWIHWRQQHEETQL